MDRKVNRFHLASIVRILVVFPTVFATGCILRDPLTSSFPEPPPPETLPPVPMEAGLQVLVLGDWGTGGDGQRALAESIAATHAANPPNFVLTVGDNFYPDGVQGPDDPMWESHFESVYEGPFWDRIVFQAILGNHDHHGVPDAQIEYSDVSPKWDMPGRYYFVEREVPGGATALFLALDTEPFSKEDSSATHIQSDWADAVLDGATADWVVVAGHHPVVTAGWHKSNEDVGTVVWPLIEGRAHLYVSGHNHSTELLETAIDVPQLVCGGGGGTDNAYRVGDTDGTLTSFTNGGWCMLRFWPSVMAVDLHDREGGIQYRYLIER